MALDPMGHPTSVDHTQGETGVPMRRVKVMIRCNRCGEVYILRGRKTKDGTYETGFVQCVCGNTDDFTITPILDRTTAQFAGDNPEKKREG
ncbi:hypothetical protein [Brockia lithotrophica]|uniref:Uncharacterized protein n=1 Tax=Brockia lithotrophica TaxID=933949 RepID=A0A660L328_9BACL|nr:hypothetical protein [Brockia lithotrophica]RKQ88411.1 hypothetical protein C7438_0044 [Brockia lithotrophica]